MTYVTYCQSPRGNNGGTTDADLLGRLRLALAERYAVERVLGQGGTAIVCLAQDLRHSRPVAIKVLRPEISLVVGAERFLNEIETVARLQHPHILPLYDSGEAGGLLYFVMPYVAGDTLRDRLEREKQLPIEDAVTITREIASALAFAHEHRVIHRDIKPENVMLFGGAAVVADFGIARVRHVAGDAVNPRMTDRGLALGTPLYMSPEQAAASGDVDARSDIYSLGCVLYEMLGGTPPFTGISPSDVLAHHLHERPRPISELRSTVPPALTLAIARALAKLPADRFRSVAEFADAIRMSGEHTPLPRPVAQRRLGWLVAAAATAAVLVVARQLVGDSSVDPARYVVLPLAEASGAAAPDGLRGEQTAMLLRSALARWSDINVVSDVLVSDAVSGNGSRPLTFDKALDMAKRLGAGRLVWGSQITERDSVRLTVGLFDVRHRGRRLKEAGFTVSRNLADLPAKVGGLSDSLVADRVSLRYGAAPIGTNSREAWNAYAAGHSALMRWDLDRAVTAFDRAASVDPGFALALLWSAQVRAWQRRAEGSWERPARSAVALQGALTSARDSAYAVGLLALADGHYQDACRSYRRVLDRDSTDVVALMGLGECNIRDRMVVKSRASATGWAFRGSMATSIRAYTRALQLAPAFNFTFGSEAYERLSALFYTERTQLRLGFALPPDTGRFAAFASLQHDTLTFVPDRLQTVLLRRPQAGVSAAIAVNRDRLRQVVEKWLQDYPSRAQPHATLATLLELSGSLGPATHGEPTALDEIRAARRLAPDSILALRYGTAEVRLLLKTWQVAAARALADSLLAAWPRPSAYATEDLAGLAALVGRAGQAASLTAIAETSMVEYQRLLPPRTPIELIQASRRMTAYAGFGGPRDSLIQLADRVSGLIVRFVNPADKRDVWSLLMGQPLSLAFLDMPSPPGHPREKGLFMLEIQDMIVRGDSTGALRLLRERRDQVSGPPGEFAASVAFQQARLFLVLGDTVGGREWLLRVLDNLAVAPTSLIDEAVQSAGLVRAMALAAELTARHGDAQAARRWATMVVQLWSDCDPEFQPLVARMRALSR